MFERIAYSMYIHGLVNVLKVSLILCMVFKTITSGYINTLLNWNIVSGAIYNLPQLNEGIILID